MDTKVAFINILFGAGFRKMEVASFVHPKLMPQMRDSVDVLLNIKENPNKIAQVLVPNEMGCRNVIACKSKGLVVWVYVTDELNYLSQNRNRSETFKEINSIVQIADLSEATVSAWIAGAFGYPGMNSLDYTEIKELIAKLIQIGCTGRQMDLNKAEGSEFNQTIFGSIRSF